MGDNDYIKKRILQILAKSSKTAGDISHIIYGNVGAVSLPVLSALKEMEKEELVKKKRNLYVLI